MKKTYVAMSTDVFREGHINILEQAAKYGIVTVGVLSDEAIATYKRPPAINLQERMRIISQFRQVDHVVVQNTLDYQENLRKLRPDYVVHGDDWRTGVQQMVRASVINTLAEWGGELIEVPYTADCTISVDLNTPEMRLPKLKRLLQLKPYIRAIDTSNGLTGIIAENANFIANTDFTNDFGNADLANDFGNADFDANFNAVGSAIIKEFDALWISSLCDSAFKGKPDIELVDLTSRINSINEIMEVTTKPIILDGDTGGKTEHFSYHVKTLERIGVSAVIIEDKTGLKQNSLFGTDVVQILDDPEQFALKIKAGKQAQTTRDFMIIARLESLIAGKDVDDALMRARIYIDAGVDGIMIHSKERDGADILDFMMRFRDYSKDIPLVLVPTTYNHFTEDELHAKGANIIIHANHLLRSAYPAMMRTAVSILENGRSLEASQEFCMPINEVLTFI